MMMRKPIAQSLAIYSQSFQRGQALIAVMALFAVAAVVFFLVFNSGRAVNEKLNLVNAADAAAYSGAQIAARQLNFIAYTNRVMIANEVAIGHVVSYQAQMDVMASAFTNIGGLAGNALETVINAGLAFVGTDIQSAVEMLNNQTAQWSGAYVLATSANNARYVQMQQDERTALGSTMNAIMDAVVAEYANNEDVSLSVNSAIGRQYLVDNGWEHIDTMIEGNGDSMQDLVGFADPSDGSEIMDLVQRTTEQLEENARLWITDRNISSYTLPGILGLLGVKSDRSGQTNLVADGAGGYTWETTDEVLNIYRNLSILGINFGITLNGQIGSVSASSVAQRYTPGVGAAVAATIRSKVCADIDCTALPTDYQSIKGQAVINQDLIDDDSNQPNVFVTAVVHQQGNCNDALGRNLDPNSDRRFGESLKGDWVDDQTRFGSACDDAENLVAVSRARILYQRPSNFVQPSNTETPNLYNPFWQAKLDYVDTRAP